MSNANARTNETSSWPIQVKSGSVTVKIYKTTNRKKPMFSVVHYDGPVRRIRQFSDLARAREEAKVTARQIQEGRGSVLELSGADRDAFLFAESKLKPLKIGLVPAILEFCAAKKWEVPLEPAAKQYHETHVAQPSSKPVPEVYNELLEAKKRDGASKAYLVDLKSRLGHFARDFHVPIAEVTGADIDEWLRELNFSPRSRNNHRNAVIGLFNFAKAAGYLNRDKSTVAEHTARARVKVEPIEIFEPEEFQKLLAGAEDSMIPFLVLGGFCGLRTSETSRLVWTDINWSDRSITIRAAISKTRSRRLAPLTEPAARWLERWKSKTGKAIKADKLHTRVKALCLKTGVAWKDNALRHSFITYRVATTKDFTKTAFEAGNSPGIIRANYDAVATEAEGKAWFSIMPNVPANIVSIAEGAA